MMKDITLGSLFDGIGAFPYAASFDLPWDAEL
jgi:hypothetical protein